MVYGYIRVSTEKQTVQNQKFEIENFCKSRNLQIDEWLSEIQSATKKLSDRKLNVLLLKTKKLDTIVVSELSRIGRNLLEIMSILHYCMEKEIKILTIKEGYELGDNINSKVLAFAFGLSAEIERTLISQRTKEALARKREEGVILGRPIGRETDFEKLKLFPYKNEILKLRQNGVSYKKIGDKFNADRITVAKFIKRIQD